jgi:pimeloyl-ACP methyl ester carboxylesterase
VQTGDDQTIRLADGRTLGYTQYGARDGFVVVSAHGGLACRTDVSAAAPAAELAGVRLISIDRPGIGLSDPKPGRTVLDWADDVAELRGQLGFDDFSVMGWSLGGQFALAVGYAVPGVRRVAVIAGGLPLTEPGRFGEMPLIDRVYLRMSQWTPWLARQSFRSMGLAARIAPNLYGRLAARDLGPADAEVIRDEGCAEFARMSAEAMRHPEGQVDDYRASLRPWGFALGDLKVPVDVWAGVDDGLLDPSWPGILAHRIPGATLTTRPGGHFLAHLYWHDIFVALTRS